MLDDGIIILDAEGEQMEKESYEFFEEITLICDEGFELVGPDVLSCMPESGWDLDEDNKPFCRGGSRVASVVHLSRDVSYLGKRPNKMLSLFLT